MIVIGKSVTEICLGKTELSQGLVWAAIGEALSEQVIDGKSKIDVSSFSLKRFKDLIK